MEKNISQVTVQVETNDLEASLCKHCVSSSTFDGGFECIPLSPPNNVTLN